MSDAQDYSKGSDLREDPQPSKSGDTIIYATIGSTLVIAGSDLGIAAPFLQVLGVVLMLPALDYVRRLITKRITRVFAEYTTFIFVSVLVVLSATLLLFVFDQLGRLFQFGSFLIRTPWLVIQLNIGAHERWLYILVAVLALVIFGKIVWYAYLTDWKMAARYVFMGFFAISGSVMLLLGSQPVHGCFYLNGATQCSAFWTSPESRVGFSLMGIFTLLFVILISRFGMRLITQLRFRSSAPIITLTVLFLLAVSQLLSPPGIWRSMTSYEFDGQIAQPDLINAPVLAPSLLWSVSTGSERVISAPVTAKGIVYVATWNEDGSGDLMALESVTGRERWRLETPRMAQDPLLYGDNVYVCSGTRVLAVEADSGDIAWEFETYGRYCAGPVEWMGLIYVVDQRGYVFALDAETGENKWVRRATISAGISRPVIVNGMIFVVGTGSNGNGETPGYMVTMDAESGDPWIASSIEQIVDSDLVTNNGKVFAVDAVGRVHMFDPKVEGPMMSSQNAFGEPREFTAVEGTVLLPTHRGYLVSYNSVTETVNWSIGNGGGEALTRPTVVGELVLVGNWTTSELWAVSLRSGERLWTVDLGPEVRCWSPILVQAGVVYLGCEDGTVRAFGSPADIEPPSATPIIVDE